MSHGWGGTAANLRSDAVVFARAGYLVVTFDYRGWGESDSRVILTSPQPPRSGTLRFNAEVLEVREVVDPIDQTTDLANAVSWVYGEPQCDRERIGLWGSSYSGGHVVYVAVRRSTRAHHGQPGTGVRLHGRWRWPTPNVPRRSTKPRVARTATGLSAAGRSRDRQLARAPLREKLMQYARPSKTPPGRRSVRCCSCWRKTKSCSTTAITASRPTTAPPGPKGYHRAQDQALRHLSRSPQASPTTGHRLVRRSFKKRVPNSTPEIGI